MYETFDSFLTDTWSSLHFLDKQRFYEALDRVVRDPEFRPERLGAYITQKFAINDDQDGQYNRARDHYVDAARIVQGYLEAIGQVVINRG